MPGDKPLGQSPVGKEKLAQGLYPTPVSGRLASLNSSSEGDSSRSADRLPWLKISLLGFLTMAPFAVALYFLGRLGPDAFLGLYLLGVIPLGGIIFMVILFGVSAGYLRKLGLQYPRMTAVAALFLTIPVLTALSGAVPWPVVGASFMVSGALGFCLSAYIFERAKTSVVIIILSAFIIGPTLLAWIIGLII